MWIACVHHESHIYNMTDENSSIRRLEPNAIKDFVFVCQYCVPVHGEMSRAFNL
jgi:hypothetical protein